MTQDVFSPCDNPGIGWQILTEFSLPSTTGNERDAVRQVEEAVGLLNLPPDRLDRLKTAVAEATLNAIEHGNQFNKDLPVSIRVMASESVMSISITDYGSSGPIPSPEIPEIEDKLEGLQTLRGWGFFIIQKMVDEMQVESDEAHHTIQLYLYLEGDSKI